MNDGEPYSSREESPLLQGGEDVKNENTWSVLEDKMGKPTIEDFREHVEQITGIDFEGSKPRELKWKDWRNLVHFLETEVGDSTDNSETQEGGT